MKVPGLEVPRIVVNGGLTAARSISMRTIELYVGDRLTRDERTLLLSAPWLADALVDVTQALVDGLEVHAPGIDPLQHAAVLKALAALAKARGEA